MASFSLSNVCLMYAYLRQTFAKLKDTIENFGSWKWYNDEYVMTETGQVAQDMANDSDEDPDTPGKDLSSSQTDPSRFASKEKLLKLCTAVAKGRHDYAFAQLGTARRKRRRRRRPQHHHATHARVKTSGTQPTAGRSPTQHSQRLRQRRLWQHAAARLCGDLKS